MAKKVEASPPQTLKEGNSDRSDRQNSILICHSAQKTGIEGTVQRIAQTESRANPIAGSRIYDMLTNEENKK